MNTCTFGHVVDVSDGGDLLSKSKPPRSMGDGGLMPPHPKAASPHLNTRL